MTKFGSAMTWYMGMYDIQYKELSQMTGISVNTLQNYTTKQHSLPNIENALKIAKALHTTVEAMYDIPQITVDIINVKALKINKIKKAMELLKGVCND